MKEKITESPQGDDPNILTIRNIRTNGNRTTRYALTHTFHNKIYGVSGPGGGISSRFRILALGTKLLIDAALPTETVAIGYTGENASNPPTPWGNDLRVTTNYSILKDIEGLPEETIQQPHNHFNTTQKYYIDNFNGSNRCREWFGHDVSESNIVGSVSGNDIRILTYFLPALIELSGDAPHDIPLPSFAQYYHTEFSDRLKFGPVTFKDTGFMSFP